MNATGQDELSQARDRRQHGPPLNAADTHIERLFEDYAGRVYRYCLSRLGSPEEAEDALQATYLNAWRSLRSGVRPVSTRPWLFQIASNVCSTVLRTRLSRGTVELRSPEALDELPMRSEPKDELLGLSAALERLPERQRHALLLRDWRGLSYDEIATELDSSYEAVETLLFRARKAVAAALLKPEPVRAPVRARALAPLPLFLPLHHGWSALKSALSSSIAPAKVSIGIALGASAPLIAFGVLQQGVFTHSTPSVKATTPAAQRESSIWLEQPTSAPLARDGRMNAEPLRSASARPAATGNDASSHPSVAPPQEDTLETAAHSSPGHSDGPAAGPPTPAPGPPPPDPGTPPPPPADDDEETPSSSVTICHHTGSEKNPGVTISVAPAAVDSHLAHGDELGACAG